MYSQKEKNYLYWNDIDRFQSCTEVSEKEFELPWQQTREYGCRSDDHVIKACNGVGLAETTTELKKIRTAKVQRLDRYS